LGLKLGILYPLVRGTLEILYPTFKYETPHPQLDPISAHT